MADGVSSGFNFDLNVVETALKHIYETDFNPMTDIEANLFHETLKTFNIATDVGIAMSAFNPSNEFIDQIKVNNAVFSAFRVHRMQNDIAAKLLDSKGVLKPFAKFANDVAPITRHHVNSWLRTEYDTAVIRAHNAANWKQFEAEKDVLPNLEWMRSTSIIPGEDHRPFWGVVYPVVASFWNDHRPGDRWNCKCRLQATDKTVVVAPKEGRDPIYAPAPGLDSNPANDGKLFSETHPFYTKAYPGAKKAVTKYMGENVDSDKVISASVDTIKLESAKAYKWIKQNIAEKGYTLPATGDKETTEVRVSRGALKDVVDHFKTASDKMLISDVVKQLPNRIFLNSSQLGEGKKGDPEKIKKNLKKKADRGVVRYNYYTIDIAGKKWTLNCEVYKKGFEKPYAVNKQKGKPK